MLGHFVGFHQIGNHGNFIVTKKSSTTTLLFLFIFELAIEFYYGCQKFRKFYERIIM